MNRLPRLKADTDVFTTFEGDNTVLLQLVAKELLTGYRDHFGELDSSARCGSSPTRPSRRWSSAPAARTLLQRLRRRAARAATRSRACCDRGYQLSMFAWREKHMLDGVARRLRAASTTASDPFEVFNAAQDHVLAAARAHVDATVLEPFVAAIDRCEDEEVKALLDKVCDLYALSTIEPDRAWFLEHGRLTPARAKAVIAAVNELCGELRPHADAGGRVRHPRTSRSPPRSPGRLSWATSPGA